MPYRRQKYYAKKANGSTIALIVVLAVLVLGLLAGLAYKSEGFKNWDVKGWFNVKEPEQAEVVESEDEEETSVTSIQTSVANQDSEAAE